MEDKGMVRTKVFQGFTSSFKEKQFRKLEQQLIESNTECLLIGNYHIVKTDYDAIIVTAMDIFVVEFKESICEGTITVNDTCWTYSDGNIVWAGNHADNPFEQMRHKRNCLFGRLRRADMRSNLFIKTMIVFSQPFNLKKGETLLKDVYNDTHGWFLSCTSDSMICTLEKHTSIYDVNIEAFTSYFGINRSLGMKKLPMRMVYLCRQFHKKIKKLFGIKIFSHSKKNDLLCIERIDF